MAGYYKAKSKKQVAVMGKNEEAMEHGKPDNEMKEKMPFSRAQNLGVYHHPPKRK